LLANSILTLVIGIAMTADVGGASLILAVTEVLGPLFLVGLLAIWTMLPHTGRLGQLGRVGLWCLGIAAGIAFVVRLVLLFSAIDVGDVVPLSSAAFALVGSVLVGWVTIRAQVVHPAIGWLLMVSGVLNLVVGLLPVGAGTFALAVIGMLAQVGAIAGYGWSMLRGATVAQRAPAHP